MPVNPGRVRVLFDEDRRLSRERHCRIAFRRRTFQFDEFHVSLHPTPADGLVCDASDLVRFRRGSMAPVWKAKWRDAFEEISPERLCPTVELEAAWPAPCSA